MLSAPQVLILAAFSVRGSCEWFLDTCGFSDPTLGLWRVGADYSSVFFSILCPIKEVVRMAFVLRVGLLGERFIHFCFSAILRSALELPSVVESCLLTCSW